MVALLLALALAGEVTEADIQAYAVRSQEERDDALKATRKQITSLRRQRIDRATKTQQLQALRARVDALSSKSAPFYPPMLTLSHRTRPMGTLDDVEFTCVQVNGKQDAIISRSITTGGRVWMGSGQLLSDNRRSHEKFYWLSGYPTSSFIDGQQIVLRGVFIVEGTKAFSDTTGGTATVPLIRAVDLTKHADQFTPPR